MSEATLPTGHGQEPPHAVCVPFPTQGHITPMLKLAKILHARGFRVTFVNTEYNHRRLVRSRGAAAVAGLAASFRFATIPDGLPESDYADATQDPATISYATKRNCPPHFRSLLAGLDGGVTCVVADNLMSFCVDAATEMGVPCALFWTASACGYMGYRNFRLLIDRGIIPFKDEEQLTNGFMDMPVDRAPGMSKHMRLKDFPTFLRTTDPDDVLMNFQLGEVERSEHASAVVINTFDELEQPALDAMRAIIPAVYTIGPLDSVTELAVVGRDPLDAVSCSLWREDRSCLAWLDARKPRPRSVVYVNFGSITVMSAQEMAEFAWGLTSSGHDFLWIVRPDAVKGSGTSSSAALPPGFLEATEGTGLLASWCDQECVLRHEAVGLFLTHSGWNSTLESLGAGVPMLCWPFFAEQQTNCRYKCVEWGVAMEVGDGGVRREAVEARVREAMGGEKGKEMARRAAEWKEAAAWSAATSLANLDRLINDVLLSQNGRLE